MVLNASLKRAQKNYYKKNREKINAKNIVYQKKLRTIGRIILKKGYVVEDLGNMPEKNK